MRNAFLIFVGGGLGSVCRYGTIQLVQRLCPASLFPIGVLAANLIGSFALGFLLGWPAFKARDSASWLLTATGFLGGYTTFSTLSGDTLQLWLNQQPWLAALNLVISFAAGVGAATLGWLCARSVFS